MLPAQIVMQIIVTTHMYSNTDTFRTKMCCYSVRNPDTPVWFPGHFFLVWEPDYMVTYLVWTNEDEDCISGLYRVIHVKTVAYHQLKEKLEKEQVNTRHVIMDSGYRPIVKIWPCSQAFCHLGLCTASNRCLRWILNGSRVAPFWVSEPDPRKIEKGTVWSVLFTRPSFLIFRGRAWFWDYPILRSYCHIPIAWPC